MPHRKPLRNWTQYYLARVLLFLLCKAVGPCSARLAEAAVAYPFLDAAITEAFVTADDEDFWDPTTSTVQVRDEHRHGTGTDGSGRRERSQQE